MIPRKDEAAALESHPWAAEIVERHFVNGIERLLDPSFVNRRYLAFERKADPVYFTLLGGLEPSLSRAFVTNWTLAHTLATVSRSWLEDIVVDLVQAKAVRSELPPPEIYSLRMLANGWYDSRRSIWNVGENWRAELTGNAAWRTQLPQHALNEVDAIVAEEERRYDYLRGEKGLSSQSWVFDRPNDSEAKRRCAQAPGGSLAHVAMKCNLLILEPEFHDRRPHAWAFRFINPTLMNRRSTVRDERVNLLRLYAWLLDQKPFRAPMQISVVAADLLPRLQTGEHGSSRVHFSPDTRWSSELLWERLGIPFAAITAGLRKASAALSTRLGAGLRQILEV